jgi:hypothetical protein
MAIANSAATPSQQHQVSRKERPWVVESMHTYWDRLPEIAERMREAVDCAERWQWMLGSR